MKTRGKVAARDEADELPAGVSVDDGESEGEVGDPEGEVGDPVGVGEVGDPEGVGDPVGDDAGEVPLVEFPTLTLNFCPPRQ